jgi:mannose-6-phosphate isomerase-like protein (cupin superfamily)
MPTFVHSNRPVFTLPGLRHQTLAGGADGLARLEIWYQSLDPGAATPLHYHECEEVVVIQSGRGQLLIEGHATNFGPDTTLTVAPRVLHQIVNTGDSEMRLIAVFSETPARVFTPDETLMALPW